MGSLTWLSRKNLFNNKCQKHYVFGKKKKHISPAALLRRNLKRQESSQPTGVHEKYPSTKKKKEKHVTGAPQLGGGGSPM